jgi:predicted nucleic acid-binding protein
MILLDTILVAEAMRPQANAGVTEWLDGQDLETLFLAAVSVAALVGDAARLPVGGLLGGGAVGLGDAVLELFEGRVLAFDRQAARCYGEIMRDVKRERRSVSRVNGLVAAVARSYGMPVAAVDVTPFWVAGCTVIKVGRG